MLVLSRQRDEGVMIGDDLLVTVRAIRGKRVYIAVDQRLATGRFAVNRFAAQVSAAWLERDEVLSLGLDMSCCPLDILGDKVHLAFELPQAVSCHRKEVYDAIRRERDDNDGGDEMTGSPVPR